MRLLKSFLPLVVSVALVLAIGGVGIAVSLDASREARRIHSADRKTANDTLAGLTKQFLLFSFKELAGVAEGHDWALQPAAPGDLVVLERLVSSSEVFSYGALLLAPDGRPMSVMAPMGAPPPPTDPGYRAMLEQLSAGSPGLSPVMPAGSGDVVGLAVPVMGADGAPIAVLTGLMQVQSSPLQTYAEGVDHGPGSVGYVVDANGHAVSSGDREVLGSQVPPGPAFDAMMSGRDGFAEFERDQTAMTAAYAPVGLGGWAVLLEQPAEAFFGPIDAGGRHVNVALLAILIAAALGLGALNYARQQALRRAYVYKGELLANTTHELKTPLTAIQGAAMTLGTRWRDLPEGSIDSLLGMIQRRCVGLGKLVDRVLVGARLDAGQELQMHPEPVDVGGILRGLALDLGEASPKHEFRVDVPRGVLAHADADGVEQILGLLAENAVKYSPDGGEIRLAARAIEGIVAVRVSDQGIGIHPDDLAQVFEPYYRANRTDSDPFGGVGLGLHIVKQLVEANGGEVSVTSLPDMGTSFTVILPRAEAEPDGEWICVQTAAERADVHPSTVRNWVRDGRIRSQLVAEGGRRRYFVRAEDVEDARPERALRT